MGLFSKLLNRNKNTDNKNLDNQKDNQAFINDKSLINDLPLPEEDPELTIFNKALNLVYDKDRPVFNDRMNRLYADDFSRGFDQKDPEQYAQKLNVILGFIGTHLDDNQYEDMLHNIRNDKSLRKLTMDLVKENDFEGLKKYKYELKRVYGNGIVDNPFGSGYADAREKIVSFLNREDKKEVQNDYEYINDENEDFLLHFFLHLKV